MGKARFVGGDDGRSKEKGTGKGAAFSDHALKAQSYALGSAKPRFRLAAISNRNGPVATRR
jgi:hypothetical protein